MPQSAWMLARLLCFSKLLSRVGVEFCVVCSFVACCTFKFFLFCRAKLHGKSMETRVLDESNLLCEHILSNDAKPFVSEVGVNDIICLACFEPQCIPSTLNRQWFCDKIDAVPDFLDNVWFSDEAHFLLSGHVNSKNNIFWGSTPPEHFLQRPLHSVKCTAYLEHHWTILVRGRQSRTLSAGSKCACSVGKLIWSTFLSASETKSFCSTDLKPWRCLLHRLDLM